MDKVPDSVLPYPANYNGSKPGRPDTSGGADSLDDSIAYGATKGAGKSYGNDPFLLLYWRTFDQLKECRLRRTSTWKLTPRHAENLEELADSQNASDDFKTKAKVIFESALNQKLQLEMTRLEEEFSARFESRNYRYCRES